VSSGGWGDVRRGVLSKWNSRIEINTESRLNIHTSAVQATHMEKRYRAYGSKNEWQDMQAYRPQVSAHKKDSLRPPL